MKKIILASASPRRKQLLEQIGLDFTIVPSNIDEVLDPQLSPREQVKTLSRQKAEATAQLSKGKGEVILAADSMVVVGDEIMGKPKDKEDAFRMLKKLSGKEHQIVTGFTLLDQETGEQITDSTETTLWFRKLDDDEIETFIEREKPYDKAGAYGLQELAAIFIERMDGDYAGAIGLPLFLLAKHLKKFGIEVL